MTNTPFGQHLVASELLAAAICHLFPGSQSVSHTPTETGFLCDISTPHPIGIQEIPLIEEAVRSLIKENPSIQITEMMRENGSAYLAHWGQSIAAKCVLELPDKTIPLIEIKNFKDYCPLAKLLSLPSEVKEAGWIKIISLSPQVSYFPSTGELSTLRIQGIVSSEKQSLKTAIKKYESAKNKDHRLIVEEMKLCRGADPTRYWLPKGVLLQDLLVDWWKKALGESTFLKVATPNLQPVKIPPPSENEVKFNGASFQPLPSRGEAHASIARHFFDSSNSPVRLAELAERWKPLPPQHWQGLLQTPLYRGDEWHVFCQEREVLSELIYSLQFFDKTIKMFGFKHQWNLVAIRNYYSAGTLAQWKQAVHWLKKSAEACNLDWIEDPLNEAVEGPMLTAQIFDTYGHGWSGPSLGIDWQHVLPHAKNGKEKQSLPWQIMLYGALMSSIERMTALLLEHYDGWLPLWLAPEQVRFLPLGERHYQSAKEALQHLKEAGIRGTLDLSQEKLDSRVHAAQQERVPYVAVIGDKEANEGVLCVRFCAAAKRMHLWRLEQFLEHLQGELKGLAGIQKGEIKKVEI